MKLIFKTLIIWIFVLCWPIMAQVLGLVNRQKFDEIVRENLHRDSPQTVNIKESLTLREVQEIMGFRGKLIEKKENKEVWLWRDKEISDKYIEIMFLDGRIHIIKGHGLYLSR